MTDTPPPADLSAAPPSPLDVREPETAACLLLLAVVLLSGDDARRLPLWPEAWGLAPPLNSLLLLLALVFMIYRIGRYTAAAAPHGRPGR
mgnify:CR=1 FL=1